VFVNDDQLPTTITKYVIPIQAIIAAMPMMPIQYARRKKPFSGVAVAADAGTIKPTIPSPTWGMQ